MTDDSISFYLTPAFWNYKNGDRVYGAIRNKCNQNSKNIRIFSVIKSLDKKSLFMSPNFNTDNILQKKNILYRNHSLARKNIEIYKYITQQHKLFNDVDGSSINKKHVCNLKELYSVPAVNTYPYNDITFNASSKSCQQVTAKSIFKSEFVINAITDSSTMKHFSKSCCWKVYRCQFNTQEESCCCSCNSDAMFEVMKSLYDCYKKKNCDNCNCILCGHLPREERRRGEVRKSGVGLASVAEKEKLKKIAKIKSKASLALSVEGKTQAEKEVFLKHLAMSGAPLPKGRTKSEKELVKKVRTELGLPQEPKRSIDKKKMHDAHKAGLIIPLEGKTPAEKEKLLIKEAEFGIPLPEGRTPSEKAMIEKIKATIPSKKRISAEETQKLQELRKPSEKIQKSKVIGLLTPMEGKTPEQKEKILRGLAMQGIPLPEAETASERKLMDRVRAEVGLPPEPKTPSAKEKYNRAMAAGIITPLEGKSASKKEDILRGQAKIGLPLPEGRTPSEKALVARVRATALPEAEVRVPSEKSRKAEATGLLTPLEGKKPEQKEKILRGLALQGIPLPEAKTASEKKLMDRVRAEVGLPPEPKTPSAKEKYNRAMTAGLITPLEGKSAARKENILRGQAEMGMTLPEGRTASEKAMINKIKSNVSPLISPLPSKRIQVTGRPALPPEKLMKLDKKSAKVMKEKKGPSDECICDLLTSDFEKKQILRTVKEPIKQDFPSYKISSAKSRKAKAAGLLTPLEGKKPEQKEKILKGLAMQGVPLPEAKTASDRKLIDKVRAEVGLPPEPKTASAKEKYSRAMAAGLITPLEGKSAARKEDILRGQAKIGLPLPEGRTPSEKALVAKVRATAPPEAEVRIPSEKLRKAEAAGLLTPLEGKKPEQKEKILRGLALQGIPLPEAKTASEKKLMDRVRAEVGLPPEPKTPSAKEKYNRAMAAGIITPLEGKSASKKEDILRGQAKIGVPLPEGRTPSEKALVAKVRATVLPDAEVRVPSEKLRKAEAAGLLTPLEGKKPEQKEKILRGLALQGIPLPEAKTASEKKLMDRVRAEVGLPPEPKTPSAKEKYNRAMAAGIITPLEGKSASKKEAILRGQAKIGLPLPEGRTPSEKALVAKIRATTLSDAEVRVPSEKLRKAKTAGLMTPLEGKKPEQKEKILRGMAMQGIPLPEAKTASEKKLMDRVRAEVGLPPEPKTPSAKEKYNRAMAAGIITPLEGKSASKKEAILRGQAKIGLPLPEGRTASEKALVAKVKATALPEAEVRVPSEKLRKVKAAGLLTPLEGKKPEQKEKVLRGLALQGIPLPEAKTASEKKLMDRVRAEVGLPPEPKTPSAKEKYNRAMAAGIITPLEGKSASKKEAILRGQAKIGLPLPEGRTPSEKALIAKVRGIIPPVSKSPEPLQQVPVIGRHDLSTEKLKKLDKKSAKVMKEKKGPSDECICDLLTSDFEKKQILRTLKEPIKQDFPSYKIPSAKLRKAKAAGLLTPLEGKKPEQKEKILKGLAMQGVPLPEAKTASDRKLIDKVRAEVGLPPEPKTASAKEKYSRAMAAGLITPLEGKSAARKEDILRGQAKMGLPLPEGRTASEKALVSKVRATALPDAEVRVPSEKLRKVKAAGLLTPLEGKKLEQKEKILRGLALQGIPLPEAKTASEKKLMDRVRAEVGLPPEPKTPSAKEKYNRAMTAGIITPLEGKSASKKEAILRGQAKMGLPLPEGRTPSEKALVAKVRATALPEAEVRVPSEKLRKAEAAGLLTPFEGKKPEQKEKILRGLALQGIPLPEAKTASEKKLMDRVRAEVGLPPEPKTPSAKEKYNRAMAAGIITPLEGKSASKKEAILRGQAKIGLPLPEGRTASEKALVAKVKATALPEAEVRVPSEKLRKVKAAGLLTPLEGKKPAQKEKALRGLALQGIPLPEAKTASEKKLMDRVRAEVGLPPEPKTPSAKEKYNRAMAAGIITPLEGKSASKKEAILRGQAKIGLPLPEGRTPSEKALVAKIRATTLSDAEVRVPSEKLRKAKTAGLMTPLEGKKPEQKEKILRGMAMQGIPLPEAKTASEKKLMERVRAEVGLPPEPKTPSAKEKYHRAMAAGIITPLEGKSASKKEAILRGQAKMGLPLPEGRTPSEKALITKVKAISSPEAEFPMPVLATGRPALPPEKLKKLDKKTARIIKDRKGPSDECICDLLTPESERETVGITVIKPPSKKIIPTHKMPSEKLVKNKAGVLLTPLDGKKPAEKERILKELVLKGIPLPEAKSASEKKIIDKVRTEVGLPLEPKELSAKKIYDKALADGIVTPLEGKSAARKEEILRNQAKRGLLLPQGRTPSEKALIAKVKATVPIEKEVILKTENGIPIRAVTPSEKELVKKAKAEGLLSPLQGKTSVQKEKILRGLAEAGLPIPEGTTPSEKALIKKVRTLAGLPLEPTPSEKKGKIKKKSKKVGIAPARKSAKGIGGAKSKGGIIEEFQDIIKTTTCDRGCGCDKKKIRFKHSYVKIRVTSPDISSLCPCPEECVPGVKGGVFTDNEGIKVTIGRITDVPSFTTRKMERHKSKIKVYRTYSDPVYCTVSSTNILNYDINYYSPSCSYSSDIISKSSRSQLNTYNNDLTNSGSNKQIIFIKIFGDQYDNSTTSISVSKGKLNISEQSITSNLESIYLLKTDSSISLITSSSMYSIISISLTETSSYDHCNQGDFLPTNDYYKMLNIKQYDCNTCYNPNDFVFGITNHNSITNHKSSNFHSSSKENFDCAIIILQTSQSDANNVQFMRSHNREFPVMLAKDCCSDAGIFEMVYKSFGKSILNGSSSLVIIMPTLSDECDKSYSIENLDSNDYIQVSDNYTNRIQKLHGLHNSYQNKGFRLVTKGKHLDKDLTLVEVFNRFKNKYENHIEQEKYNKYCQVCPTPEKKYQIISTDTTQDRPCCCPAKENSAKGQIFENIISEIVRPMILTEAVAQGLNHQAYINLNENTSVSHKSLNKLNLCNPTPLQLCKVPPCSGRTKCHQRPISNPKDSSIDDVAYVNMKPCSCSIDKIREIVEKTAKQMRSIGCGNSEEDLRGEVTKSLKTAMKLSSELVDVAKRPRSSCKTPKVRDDEPFSSLCGVKKRKIKGKNICPCEQNQRSSQAHTIDRLSSDKPEAFSSDRCQCKAKGRSKDNKNTICECPEEFEPQFMFDARDWIDEAQIRKMKSNLTQTVSGFKLNIPRRIPESDESFEEILKYFAENTEQYDSNKFENISKACSCNEKSQLKPNVPVECECPYESPLPDEVSSPEEPFQGIKLHIGGKGSDSKGLSGILCFEILELVACNNNLSP